MKKIIVALAFFAAGISAKSQIIQKVKMDDIVKLFDNKSDTIYVVNFWATFCKPCIAEMPGLIKVADKYKDLNVKLILVSLDLPDFYPKKIAAFVAERKFDASIAWLNETNADHFCPMISDKWSGAIPATIIVNAKSGYKKFFDDEITEDVFEAELRTAASSTPAALSTGMSAGGK